MRLPRPPGDEGWELEIEDESGYAFIAADSSSIWLSDVAAYHLLACAHDGASFSAGGAEEWLWFSAMVCQHAPVEFTVQSVGLPVSLTANAAIFAYPQCVSRC